MSNIRGSTHSWAWMITVQSIHYQAGDRESEIPSTLKHRILRTIVLIVLQKLNILIIRRILFLIL